MERMNWYYLFTCEYCKQTNLFSNERNDLHECSFCGKKYKSRIENYVNDLGEWIRIFICFDGQEVQITQHPISLVNCARW